MRRTDELTDAARLRLIAAILAAPTLADGAQLLDRVPAESVDRVVGIARRHGVEAWLAACAPPAARFEPLRRQRPLFLAAQARTAAAVGGLREVLARLGCPWVVLKGPALAHSVYPRADLRHAVDLDVLVPPVRFGDVLVALQDAGFTLLDRNWPLLAARTPGELRVRAPQGILVDLHWSLLDGPALQRAFHLPTTALLARAREIDPPGIPALSEVDQVVHLGVHGALSGANRLGWLLDAHLAARRMRDWDAVVVAASEAGAGRSLALVLARAWRIWQTPVPPRALRALGGGSLWRAADRLVDPRGPVRGDPERSGAGRAWARSARATRARTLAGFARHGLAWLHAGRPRAWHAISFDPDDPASPLHRIDDADARRRYLAEVAAAD